MGTRKSQPSQDETKPFLTKSECEPAHYFFRSIQRGTQSFRPADHIEKPRFDEELRRFLGSAGNDGSTFWTMCPYCYHVYEYEKNFEECCLRCANERCRRGFQAVAIGVPPPPELVEKGRYWCPGFMPFGFSKNTGEENGENLWVPFAAPMETRVPFAAPMETTSKGCDLNADCNGEGLVIDISDDEIAGTEEAKEMELQDHVNGKKSNIKEEASTNGKFKDANGKKSESRAGTDSGFMENNVKEVGQRRKKSVPWNSKKLFGRGIIIDKNQALAHGVCEEGYSNVEGLEGNEELVPGVGDERSNDFENGVEFFEGDDDIFVGLQCDFDFGNGEL